MIKNPYEVADKLWTQWLESDTFEAAKDCVLEVDCVTLNEMQRLYDQWMTNVMMIGSTGDPCQEYRGRWKIKAIRHYKLPEMPVRFMDDDWAEVATSASPDPITPHMALIYTKPNGRQVAIDWEGNDADLT